MDSNEIGRQAAERLHENAVARGRDPSEPYKFSCAEAERRELEVAKVPVGDVRLHGGRAVYDPDALLILHEDTGDPFTDAFLVAHELGHVELGGQGAFSITAHADPSRPSEAAPVGVDRVVDYSRRERREVQMDLFAREFLLPRSWVRRLHLEQAASASAIAALIKAPFAVVAQQLFDALLLPTIAPPEPAKPSTPKPLHPDQAEAVKHRGKPYLLEAGPGTGKTQTLVARIDDLLRSGVPADRILVLTFSNKAAGELSERIALLHAEAAATMWIGTFHAFGLDLIRRFHDLLGLPTEPRLIDRTEAIELLENEYPRLELVHFKNLSDPSQPLGLILNAISRANDEVADAARYRSLAEATLSVAVTPEQREVAERTGEVAAVFEAYERIKLENGCVDFGDLVSMPVRLCETSVAVREHLIGLYEHVLVDEFQDVNRSSIRLLKAITRNGDNLWAVGDAKQSIYRFRGASSFNMSRFGRDDFPGGERGRLTINYRSVAEVRDTFLAFASKMRVARGADVSLEVDRGKLGHLPEHRTVGTDDEEIAAAYEAIEEMRAAGYAYRDQAILCSGNDRLGRFARGLEQLGVPVLYLGSLFERDEIKTLLCFLSLLVDRRAVGLLKIAAIPEYTVSLTDVATILSYLKDDRTEPLQWANKLDEIHGLTVQGLDALTKIARLFEDFGLGADPWTLLATLLLDRTRIAAEISSATNIGARAQGIAIWQFMNFLRNQPTAEGIPAVRLLARIRRLVLHADERNLRQLPAAAQGIDAVRLMTMHGSKGLEFPVVHIPGLTAASLPGYPNSSLARTIAPPDGLIEGAAGSGADAAREAIHEERECLFFVAMSRARDRLFFYHPTKSANDRSRPESPFLKQLGKTVITRPVVPSATLSPSEGSLPVSVSVEGSFAFSDHQLALYERCPRRFLYTHILEIGGRRTETAFMKLHMAVQQVVAHVANRPNDSFTMAELEEPFANAWDSSGPADHGYSEDYKRIAWQLIQFFLDSASAMEHLTPPQLSLPVAGGEIVITPDQMLSDGAGKIHMRRVRTGHKGSKDEDSLGAAAFHIAANHHSPGCTVQLVYLSDAKVTSVKITDRTLGNRQNSIAAMISAVREGRFPLVETVTCPSCPAFFVCGRLPAGTLAKNFSG